MTTGPTTVQRLLGLACATAVLGGLALIGRWDHARYFLVFHTLVELLSIGVAMAVFLIAWNVRRQMKNDFILFIALVYAAVGLLDLLHTMAYSGMGAIPDLTTNEPTQLWIAARYLQALGLLIAPLWLTRRLPLRTCMAILALTDALVIAMIFRLGSWLPAFPVCHLGASVGQSSFKIASEYVISALLLAAAVALWMRRARLDRTVFVYMAAAVIVTMAAEIAFTSYVDVTEWSNLVGHLLKTIAAYLTYAALVEAGLRRPFDTLFRELSASEDRYRSLFDRMTEGFALHEVLVDAAGRPCDYRFLDVNPAFEALTGLKRADLVGRRVREAIPGIEEYWISSYGRVALTGEPLHMENYSATLGRWYDVVAYRPAPMRFAVIFSDITRRKQAEQALRELNASLEQRVAERTAEAQQKAERLRALAAELAQTEQRERKRLAGLLHDHIQQLLVAARMQVELLQRPDAAQRAPAAAGHVDALLQEALAASRSLAVELSPPALQEAGLIGGLNWLAARTREKNRFAVHLHADSDAEPATEDTRLLLFECARELLLNAMKHSGAAEAHVTLRRTAGGQVQLTVRDAGRGFHVDDLRKRSAGEASLGLFSIQQRLAHIGGVMEVESAPGSGTTVTLTAPDDEPTPLRAAPAASFPGSRRRPIRVLLADDQRLLRQLFAERLGREADLEVVGEAQDGEEAVRLALERRPDVVVLDLRMPGMDGIEAARALRAQAPACRVIGLSSYDEQDGPAKAMREAGAVACVLKESTGDDLVAAIRAAVPA